MREKYIIRIARVFSALFSPFYMPLIGVSAFCAFGYLNRFSNLLPLVGLFWCCLLVFTIILPNSILLSGKKKMKGAEAIRAWRRKRRVLVLLAYVPAFIFLVLLLTMLFAAIHSRGYRIQEYILLMLCITYCFTILLPRATIFLYRELNGWARRELDQRERRVVPYVISIASYMCCMYLMVNKRMPHYVDCIIMAALMLQITCAFINIWWKISTHTAAAGGVVGAFVAFSLIFNFNPAWWLCPLLLLAGAVGTSRIILRQHSLEQVAAGFGVGFLCGFLGIFYF